jgi:hypothetical protein
MMLRHGYVLWNGGFRGRDHGPQWRDGPIRRLEASVVAYAVSVISCRGLVQTACGRLFLRISRRTLLAVAVYLHAGRCGNVKILRRFAIDPWYSSDKLS